MQIDGVNYISAYDVFIETGCVNVNTVRSRAYALGFKPIRKGSNRWYTLEQAEAIISYKPKRRISGCKKFSKTKIRIVEEFLSTFDNRATTIASTLNCSEQLVHNTLTEWLETGCVTVASAL
jgi:hypothetical protein